MIGMNVNSFVTLLVVGGVVAFVFHYIARYRAVEGAQGFFGKLIIGWLGAWLGSPVLGHWGENIRVENIYLAPALLDSIAAVFGTVLFFKTLASLLAALVAVKSGSWEMTEAERKKEAA
jgi:uncharacterized membrane protein YeaQ/YmgE (transglycosylase-associated protein family)